MRQQQTVANINISLIYFSEIYGFLENALTGQPQKKLSKESEAFFSHEIEVRF